MRATRRLLLAAITVTLACASGSAQAQQAMSFFVTSVGPGKGGNLGGLLGADRHCQMLATAAGAGNKTWHAYLSENGSAGHPTINAKDRIGNGPWYNAKGALIANNVADLHSDKNNINKMTALTEKGERNSAHDTAGCSQDEIKSTGGDGLLYCFAVN